MDAVLWLVLVALIVDGVKMLVEVFSKPDSVPVSIPVDVTAIIAAHNEEKVILLAVRALKRHVPEERIIVVDDQSTDRTVSVLKSSGFRGRIVELKENVGKVRAYDAALDHVETRYTLLLDADVVLGPEFLVPASFFTGDVTAVAFNVVPTAEVPDNKPMKVALIALQKYEYLKSMVIGRRYHSKTRSVHCISGAAGLFWTARLRQLSKKHSGIFPGEDLERTLIELEADGQVAFSDSRVLTFAPCTLRSLVRQRIVGWWPGLWRNILTFFKLIVRRKEPFRLRWELAYEIFALLTDPLKAIALVGLVLGGEWGMLYLIYAIYFIFEVIVASKLKSFEIGVVVLYPLYSTLQMFLRLAALGVFVYKRFIVRHWALAMLLLAPVLAQSQVTIGWQGGPVIDQPQGRMAFNHNLYLGYDNVYAGVASAPYKQANVGMYNGPWMADIRYRWEVSDVLAKVQYEHWFGDFAPRVMAGYSLGGEDFMIGGVGASYYLDNVSLNADVIHEWGRVFGTTYVGSVKMKDPDGGPWATLGGSMTNFGHGGVFAQLGYGPLYFFGETTDRYDFNNFTRTAYGVGFIWRIP